MNFSEMCNKLIIPNVVGPFEVRLKLKYSLKAKVRQKGKIDVI